MTLLSEVRDGTTERYMVIIDISQVELNANFLISQVGEKVT